jgi:uncharacterized membrane protein
MPMSNTNVETSKWRSRGLPVALLLSLVVNIGLIGFLTGRWTNPTATPHMPPPSIGMGRFLRSLDESRRDELKPYLSAHFDSLRPNIRTSRKAHKAVRAAIAAEPFAPALLEQALFKLNSNRGGGAAEQARTLTSLVNQLSGAERSQLATNLARPRGHGIRGGRSRREHKYREHHSDPDEMSTEQPNT